MLDQLSEKQSRGTCRGLYEKRLEELTQLKQAILDTSFLW